MGGRKEGQIVEELVANKWKKRNNLEPWQWLKEENKWMDEGKKEKKEKEGCTEKKKKRKDLQGKRKRLNKCRLHGGVMNDTSLGSHSSICPSPPPSLPISSIFFPPSFSAPTFLFFLLCPFPSFFVLPPTSFGFSPSYQFYFSTSPFLFSSLFPPFSSLLYFPPLPPPLFRLPVPLPSVSSAFSSPVATYWCFVIRPSRRIPDTQGNL